MNAPTAPTTTSARFGARALRGAVAVLSLLLAGLALSRLVLAERHRRASYDWLSRSGVTADPSALEREDDPQLMDLLAARIALNHEMKAQAGAERATQGPGAALEGAARRSRSTLRSRPASWEAAFVLGSATYLARTEGRDPRLLTAYRDWEAPLEAAQRLAPTRRAPQRMLAGIYLDLWPALSARKRSIAQRLVAETFADPTDLDRLLPVWLDVAADRDEAFAVIPDQPGAWEKVQALLGSRGDLMGFREARQRWNRSLLAALRRDLTAADRQRAAGNIEPARGLYLSVATRARPERGYLDLLEQALDRCPPGPVDKETAARLAPHLTLALDRCLDAGCEMKPETLKRLSSFVRDLAPQPAALAALFAGDLSQAAQIERRATALWSEEWAPYWIAKARALAARSDLDEARGALAEVHHDWQKRPLYWQAKLEVARAARDESQESAARSELAALARREWGTGEWGWRKEVARLELVADAAAPGIEIGLAEVPAAGSVIEARLDGVELGAFAVPASGGGETLRLAVAVQPGLHVLELTSTYGGRVLPGPTHLL